MSSVNRQEFQTETLPNSQQHWRGYGGPLVTGQASVKVLVSLHTGLRLDEVLQGRYDPAKRVVILSKTKTGGAVEVPVTRRAVRVMGQAFTVGANQQAQGLEHPAHHLLPGKRGADIGSNLTRRM